jgi:hypothetical protein
LSSKRIDVFIKIKEKAAEEVSNMHMDTYNDAEKKVYLFEHGLEKEKGRRLIFLM